MKSKILDAVHQAATGLRKSDAITEDTESFLTAVAGTLGDDFPDDITDDASINDAVESDTKNVWERTSGAWQGAPLVREPEERCEIVQTQAPVSSLKDPDMQKVPQALMRASEKARQLAEQTGTPFVVHKSAAVTGMLDDDLGVDAPRHDL